MVDRRIRLLMCCSATSAFDRFVSGPLLLSIAASFSRNLAAVTAVASVYFLCYGLSQPLWGLSSDRLGRVRTMRLALSVAAVAGTVSALSPSLPLLVVARALTGASVAAVVPAGLVYVGDVVPFARRQAALTDLNAATAAGIAVATALGGLLASALSWRVAFAVPAAAAAALVVALRGLPEPQRAAGAGGGRGVAAVLRSRWGWRVLLLALVEGAVLLGLLTYLPPALEDAGSSATTAGLVVGLYGVGLLLTSRVVKRLAGRVAPAAFVAGGGSLLVVAYALLIPARTVPTVAAAALLVGAGWAFLHSTMQAWATEAVPGARAATVSLFAGCLFLGSGVSTAALAGLAGDRRWPVVFAIGAVLAALFTAVAAPSRARAAAQAAAGVPVPE